MTNTSIIQRVISSTFSNYVAKIITLGSGFLLTPLILQTLGADTYGLWILVSSVISYGGLLELGIANAVIKYIAEYHVKGEIEQARNLVATALSLYIVLGIIVFGLSCIVAPFFPYLFNISYEERNTSILLVLLLGLNVSISIPCATASSVLRGLQRFDLINVISVIGTLLYVASIILVLQLGGGVVSIVVSSIVITLLMQIPSIWFVYRAAPELRFGLQGAKLSLAYTVLSFSSSIFLMNVSSHLQTKTDEVVIGASLPIREVTPYSIARRLSEIAQIFTDQFMKILLPLASEFQTEDNQVRLRALYIVSTRVALASFIPIGCTIIILAQFILTVWVGPSFANYTHIILILTIAGLIDTSQWPAGLILQGMSRHQPLAKISICSAVVNLVLSIFLVRPFGVTGVALGTLIPTTIECFVFVMPYALRIIGVSVREACLQIFLPAIVPALPMILILYGFSLAIPPSSLLSIMIIGSAGILVYILGYLSIGTNTLERRACRDVVRTIAGFTTAHLKNLWL